MNCTYIPNVKLEKNRSPSIYLDTNAMIELSKYERGVCTDMHKQEIGKLYDILTVMMRETRILCPLGNQLQEMGMTKGKESAKLFLYRFTNSELLHPDLVQAAQMKAGYYAFANNNATIELDIHTAFKENRYPNSPFVIHVDPQYSPEKADDLRREKDNIAAVLNKMKADKLVKATFDDQLRAELESEYISFLSALKDPMASEKTYMRYSEEIGKFYYITGFSPSPHLEEQFNHLALYTAFLLSPHHDVLPYIWIRANLWSHLMHRPKKIIPSDNLDIQWVAAYLPFVDYAVTDTACCRLLQESGLAALYGTKVYSFKTLGDLLDGLSNLNETCTHH